MVDRSKFQASMVYAKNSFDRNHDIDSYLGSTLKTVLQLLAEEHGQGRVSNVLTVSSPVFAAIIDYGRDGFECPVDSGHSVHSFLSGLNNHIKDRLRRDYYRPAEKHLPEGICNVLSRLIDLA